MTASLPREAQTVFARFLTTEYTTIDLRRRPVTWPVAPHYRPGAESIDLSTPLDRPKKASDARANPKVALLFSDPTGSGLERPPMALVQGIAQVDDADLEANRRRHLRESLDKPAGTAPPPAWLRRLIPWHFARIYVSVRPERVWLWPEGEVTREPELFDSHMEEVRSGRDEVPDADLPAPEGGAPSWDEHIEDLGRRYSSAVLAFVSPDGFPFAVRLPWSVDPVGRRIHLGRGALGIPVVAGPACLTAHEHAPDLGWQRNVQLRGDIIPDRRGWSFVPYRLVGGVERSPRPRAPRHLDQLRHGLRLRRNAQRELARRAARFP